MSEEMTRVLEAADKAAHTWWRWVKAEEAAREERVRTKTISIAAHARAKEALRVWDEKDATAAEDDASWMASWDAEEAKAAMNEAERRWRRIAVRTQWEGARMQESMRESWEAAVWAAWAKADAALKAESES